MCTNLKKVLNRLVCRCANFLVMANEIAGFRWSEFILVNLGERLAVRCLKAIL
jgi:hypothetical protein